VNSNNYPLAGATLPRKTQYIALGGTKFLTSAITKNQFPMKVPQLIAVAFLLSLLSSCQIVGGIFKAGVWVGVLLVLLVIGLIVFFIAKASGGR
jgi:hypothetical protein